mmetsp:Transcript_33843/g.38476  ORF Transcript_33843/g.38476 Transcript_33843/m.38476 type:complete len:398 (+) Transcript_33843:53-1246(+)
MKLKSTYQPSISFLRSAILIILLTIGASNSSQFSSDDEYYAWHRDRINQRWLPLDLITDRHVETPLPIHVYIISSGIDRHHIWLSNKCAPGDSEHFVTFDDSDDDCSFTACDVLGYGTYSAGLVASDVYGYNTFAILHAVKVTDKNGEVYADRIVDGAQWVISHDAGAGVYKLVVVDVSIDGGDDSVDQAMDDLLQAGIPVVTGAGDGSGNACLSSPSRVPGVLAVAGTTEGDQRWESSNYGDCVDLFAPAERVHSTLPDNYMDVRSTTRASGAFVAGFASALKTRHGSNLVDHWALIFMIQSYATPNLVQNSESTYDGVACDIETVASITVVSEGIRSDQNLRITSPQSESSSWRLFEVISVLALVAAVATGAIMWPRSSTRQKTDSYVYDKIAEI